MEAEPQMAAAAATARTRKRRPSGLADRRTYAHRRLEEVRTAYLDSFNGSGATPFEAALIERAAILSVCIEAFDRRAFAGELDEGGSRIYIGYVDSLSRLLAQLGLSGQRSI
jgi:hypothetical protein